MQLFDKIRRPFCHIPAASLAASFVFLSGLFLLLPAVSAVQAQDFDVWNEDKSGHIQLDEFQITSELNAYDPRLIEPMYQHARQLQEAGSHDQALELFKEALHISRINNGLYNASQIDLLDAMIASEMSLQDWESVDKYYGYMEHLYRRLYDMSDPRLESGLQKVVSWHVNALNVNIDDKRVEHLQQANKIFKLRLQIARQTLRNDDPKVDYLNRNIEICERQLFQASELGREMQRREQSARRRALLADSE